MTTTNRRLLIAANRPVDILRRFTFDTTGGNAGISTCNAFIKRIKGSTIVWNQQIFNGNFADGTNGWTILNADNISVSQNVISLYNQTTSTAISFENTRFKNRIQGHIYIAKFRYKFAAEIGNNIASAIFGNRPTLTADGNWHTYKYIGTLYDTIYYIRPTTLTNVLLQFSDFTAFDLTLMFGAGNEPATVAEFEALFPLDYYDYNAGQLLSFTGDDIKTTGFNQWDEQWELGTLGVSKTTPVKVESSTQIRSKNKIPVFPNTTYCISCSSTNTGFFVIGINDNFGGTGATLLTRQSGYTQTFTTQSTTRYIAFSMAAAYGTTYKYDICVNISHNGTKNGTYEEYEQHTKDISFYKSIKDGQGNTLFPYGLLSAGSVYDEVTATKAIKRIGAVDLGTLTWSYGATESHERMISQGIMNLIKHTTNATTLGNILCVKYTTGTANDSWFHTIDNVIASDASGILYVYSTTMGTSGAAFKETLQGVMLYYELAEPIEVSLSDIDLTYYANKWGTEHLLPDNTSVPTTTFAFFDVRYKVGTPRT